MARHSRFAHTSCEVGERLSGIRMPWRGCLANLATSLYRTHPTVDLAPNLLPIRRTSRYGIVLLHLARFWKSRFSSEVHVIYQKEELAETVGLPGKIHTKSKSLCIQAINHSLQVVLVGLASPIRLLIARCRGLLPSPLAQPALALTLALAGSFLRGPNLGIILILIIIVATTRPPILLFA